MTAPLVGAGIGSANPREFLELLEETETSRQLRELHAQQVRAYEMRGELLPLTGKPPLVDIPALLRKRAALGRFDAAARETGPVATGAINRGAIEALKAAAEQSACTFGKVHALAGKHELEREAARVAPNHDLVQTRVELPPVDKSLDVRHLRAQVRNSVRKLHALRSNGRKCGRQRYALHVDARVKRMDDGSERGMLSGIVRCGSVHTCPVCSGFISSARAEHVRAVVTAHREQTRTTDHPEGGVDMLTLTVHHEAQFRCKRTRRQVSKAWQLMQRGAPWQRLKRRMGFVGSITAREITHGGNGWHPHLHILIAHNRPWSADERAELESELYEQWCSATERVPGYRLDPSRERGVKLTASYREDYIQKLGLADELMRAIDKKGRAGNRTPFEIMADYHRSGSKRDEKLLREYICGIKGSRQLTWSRGKNGNTDLRKIYAAALLALEPQEPEQTDLGFESDLELLKREEQRGAIVSSIPGRVWDALTRVMRRVGADAEYWIVTAAEHSGTEGVEAAIARAWYVGRELAKKDPQLRRWVRWLEPRDPIGVSEKVHALLTNACTRA